MGFTERRARVDPEVQIDEHGIRRAARADLLGSDDTRYRFHYRADLILGDDDLVCENTRRFPRNLPTGMPDEHRNDEAGKRIENRITKPDTAKSGHYGKCRPHIALGMPRIRAEHFAAQTPAGARLVADNEDIDGESDDHRDHADGKH